MKRVIGTALLLAAILWPVIMTKAQTVCDTAPAGATNIISNPALGTATATASNGDRLTCTSFEGWQHAPNAIGAPELITNSGQHVFIFNADGLLSEGPLSELNIDSVLDVPADFEGSQVGDTQYTDGISAFNGFNNPDGSFEWSNEPDTDMTGCVWVGAGFALHYRMDGTIEVMTINFWNCAAPGQPPVVVAVPSEPVVAGSSIAPYNPPEEISAGCMAAIAKQVNYDAMEYINDSTACWTDGVNLYQGNANGTDVWPLIAGKYPVKEGKYHRADVKVAPRQ